jgi:transcriptional regulator with XRE-family HTH domain
LAKKIGADQHRISKYENATVFPTVDVLVKIATVFDASLDYLVRDKEEIDISKIPNQELARKIDKISRLGKEEQQALNLMIDALIKKQQLEEIIQR